MTRFVCVALVAALVSCACANPERRKATQTYKANADEGSVSVGHVSGGTFGKGSFTSQRNGNHHDNDYVNISNNPVFTNSQEVNLPIDINVGNGNHRVNNYGANSNGGNHETNSIGGKHMANTYGAYQGTYSYGRPAGLYGRPAGPYDRPAGPYDRPAGPYGRTAGPYGHPAEPYRDPAEPYRDPVEYYDPTWYW